jgi:hypothetical protein
MSRQKKYKMKAIPSAISEKGGFTAQFIGDGYSVDARKEILPLFAVVAMCKITSGADAFRCRRGSLLECNSPHGST